MDDNSIFFSIFAALLLKMEKDIVKNYVRYLKLQRNMSGHGARRKGRARGDT